MTATKKSIQAPSKYAQIKGNASLVYDAICKVLSDRGEQVEWQAFAQDEWDLLISMAKSEGVGPLLYWKMRNQEGNSSVPQWPLVTPKEVVAALIKEYHISEAQNKDLFKELAHIRAAFEEAEIPLIVFKGVALAQTLYPDPGLRPMGDIDLLVKEKQYEPAVKLLAKLGYEEYLPDAAPGLTSRLSHHIHMRLSHHPNLLVELHYRLLGSEAFKFSASGEWFWEHAQPWTEQYPQTKNIWLLTPTANLLYLSAHAVLQHSGTNARLLWYHDIAALLEQRSKEIDWTIFLNQAKALEWGSAVKHGLHLVQERLAVEIPAEAQQMLAEISDKSSNLVLLKSQPAYSQWDLEWRKMSGLSWQARWALAWALIFPAPEYMKWRYQPRPEALWPIWYFYRWADVAKNLVLSVTKSLSFRHE